MKLTEKTYSVRQLTENRDEYIVEEVFYVLGIALWHSYHCVEGDIPFESYFAAKQIKKQLEKKEEKNAIDREIALIFFTVFFIVFAGLIVIKNCLLC